jgi:hypothetical protein
MGAGGSCVTGERHCIHFEGSETVKNGGTILIVLHITLLCTCAAIAIFPCWYVLGLSAFRCCDSSRVWWNSNIGESQGVIGALFSLQPSLLLLIKNAVAISPHRVDLFNDLFKQHFVCQQLRLCCSGIHAHPYVRMAQTRGFEKLRLGSRPRQPEVASE